MLPTEEEAQLHADDPEADEREPAAMGDWELPADCSRSV